SASRQLVEQRPGLFQDRRIEPLREPAIDRGQQLARGRAVALFVPDAGEAGCGAQLKYLGALSLCDGERKMIALLGRGSVPGDVQHIASHTMKLGLAPPLVSRLDDLARLGKASLAFRQPPEFGVGLGEGRQYHRGTLDSSSSASRREPLRQRGDAFLCLAKRSQRPSVVNHSATQPE